MKDILNKIAPLKSALDGYRSFQEHIIPKTDLENMKEVKTPFW